MFAHRSCAEQLPANDLEIEVKDKHQRRGRGQWHARPEAQSQRNEYHDGYNGRFFDTFSLYMVLAPDAYAFPVNNSAFQTGITGIALNVTVEAPAEQPHCHFTQKHPVSKAGESSVFC